MLVVALGVAAVLTTSSASREATWVHTHDRSKAQEILAGLSAQYLRFAALELSQQANSGRWTLAPGSGADRRRLRAFIRTSSLFGYGAAITGLDGRPLAAAAGAPGLPAPNAPGYAPMAAALRSGKFGVSNVMSVGTTSVVAMAVPISQGGRPHALMIGFADVNRWPLGVYTARQVPFDPSAMTYIVDGDGTVAASRSASAVGRRIAAPLIRVGERHGGLLSFSEHGKAFVATYSPTGIGGWRAMTVEPAAAFSGALERRAHAVGATLLALLVAAIGGLVLLTLKRNQALRRIADEALYDQLTGLQSRRLFAIRLQDALTKQKRTGAHHGVLFSDLDNFKVINDHFGHAAGDAALQEVARRLRAHVRAGDSVARLGGDEFVVLLEDVDEDAFAATATALKQAVDGPVLVEGFPIDLRVSIGGVLVEPGESSSAAIMHAADLAMYRAKASEAIEISPIGWHGSAADGRADAVHISRA